MVFLDCNVALTTFLKVGSTIKEKLVPKAVSWYTGEAVEDDPYYCGDDDDEEG